MLCGFSPVVTTGGYSLVAMRSALFVVASLVLEYGSRAQAQ